MGMPSHPGSSWRFVLPAGMLLVGSNQPCAGHVRRLWPAMPTMPRIVSRASLPLKGAKPSHKENLATESLEETENRLGDDGDWHAAWHQMSCFTKSESPAS